MIKFENVRICYGKHVVLDHLDESWDGKGILILGGNNGAGKSSLIKALANLIDYEGSINYKGEVKMMKSNLHASYFAYVPQQKNEMCHERVVDFMIMGSSFKLSLFEQPKKEDLNKAIQLLDEFKLSHLTDAMMDELSGGEVAMVYVARCFMEKHDILLLDEPCAHLDFHHQYEFMKMIATLVHKHDIGAVISMHDPNLALFFATHLWLIHNHHLYYHKMIENKEDQLEAANAWNKMTNNSFEIIQYDHQFMVRWKIKE